VSEDGKLGQAIARGVIFTLPALIFLGFDLEYMRIFCWHCWWTPSDVLFRSVRRHMMFWEGTAGCFNPKEGLRDGLLAGERGGSLRGRSFLGLGGWLYTFSR